MSQAASALTRTPAEVVRQTPVSQASNGICYASSGEVTISANDLERMIAAVPRTAAAALERKAYYFVPLTVSQGDDTVIADRYDVVLSDSAVCHRNLNLGDAQCVFISTRLMDDKFSVAFEFYINVGHAIVERIGSPGICRPCMETGRSRRARRNLAGCVGCAQSRDRLWRGNRKVQERILRRRVFRRDFDLPALAVS
jgi:hypothetical protein